MTRKLTIGLISLCLLALVACSVNRQPPIPIVQTVNPVCPAVPECDWPLIVYAINNDLVTDLIAGQAAFQQCKAARDTAVACINRYRE